MKTRVQIWGNSLALRIPRPFADEAGLEKDSPVELSLVEGKLVITPIARTRFSLEQLLAQISAENLHGEVETGAAVGAEAW